MSKKSKTMYKQNNYATAFWGNRIYDDTGGDGFGGFGGNDLIL